MTQSTHSQPTLTVTPDSPIGALVAAQPALARFFERLGIDYCCGGKQTLAAACKRLKLDVGTTLALLDSTLGSLATTPAEVNAAGMGLAELADHIESTHHAYLKEELPRLVEMANRVALKHSWRDVRLTDVAAAVNALAEEMLTHMQKEEKVLFPAVRRIEAGARGDISAPIAQMEAEHEVAGNLTAKLRLLTDGFTPNAEACNTHRALLAGLTEFEVDLHQHVHKENNILFPRALALGRAA
ncbi:MAG TPA: iron-sulfur cluster repair di-iron protein [Lacunisphaera sp.]|nr:iron-sulfur cluster repair di-iron protein [Lacunisphaera sp.]